MMKDGIAQKHFVICFCLLQNDKLSKVPNIINQDCFRLDIVYLFAYPTITIMYPEFITLLFCLLVLTNDNTTVQSTQYTPLLTMLMMVLCTYLWL